MLPIKYPFDLIYDDNHNDEVLVLNVTEQGRNISIEKIVNSLITTCKQAQIKTIVIQYSGNQHIKSINYLLSRLGQENQKFNVVIQ